MSEKKKLAKKILRAAAQKGLTIGTAESCTAGWIGKTLTDPAGSSSVFMGGLITYSNEAKMSLLGVSPRALRAGAVSKAVAIEMADGARERLGVDIAISVTGIAGPGGGTANKPIGTVWFSLSQKGKPTEAIMQEFGNTGRRKVRKDTVIYALKWLDEIISA